jgi:hypothetical protein
MIPFITVKLKLGSNSKSQNVSKKYNFGGPKRQQHPMEQGPQQPRAPGGAVAVQLASLPPPIAEPGPAAPKPAAVAAELTPTMELQLSNGKAMGKSMGKWENLCRTIGRS